MTDIKTRLNDDIKAAMKAKDAFRRDTLRNLSAAMKQAEIDGQKELTEEDQLKILQKEAKRRQESIDELKNAGRDAAGEEAELDLINSYLPEQLDESEIKRIAQEVIAETGASSLKEMGNVMKELMPRLAGQADGKVVNQVVRRLLSDA